ncbi:MULTISPECIES: gluconokinase [Burkholderia]|jgi:gluconokinase|uniref:Gluconokinase n=2 Tax=Burkholderia cenocepacia TaxID=95486 RepID=A0A1V2XGJ1_9BURK|nr:MULTISPECIES: gluconokinase [Burkholderia]AIO47047.1 carbohydrate kinase, thermoresistant glucokinase family protein [Burkholderia cepacia]AMU04982.1 gluconate kinase [Burkholderia cenocepacia]AOK33290.1 gluconate kinase [Burkholderia cenocepacia]EPZ91898.1 carbohydrate kinase, thermoresistant glucokinase family [Burkholderia cenocepacia K56-2Valvano]ERI30821.1 carbohydrate kinase, thermoresistant glucokinase family [Burkholderia cenocepacia BC7]
MILIAMGVSGAGKSLIGEMLAERLSCSYTDGDAFHSAANKEKMHHGIPLTDEDRWPWLRTIRAAIEEKQRAGETAVFTCSSLKRSYRDVLRGADTDVRFVYLKGSFEVLQERLKSRTGHFFDPSLLKSQLDTLEEPGPDEAIEVSIELTPEQIVDQVMLKIGLAQQH